MNLDLFDLGSPVPNQGDTAAPEQICPGAFVLRAFALPQAAELLAAITQVASAAPARSMHTPGGLPMSVATSSCGTAGWVSDHYGYRYARLNPDTRQPWPVMPEVLLVLAQTAAASVGFANFVPDSCLINYYQPGAKLTLHQDKNERDFSQPIVSVSLGLPAVFLMGGNERSDSTQKIPLSHGDVMVWGGPARMYYHGVLPIKPGTHPLVGEQRINLTFRKAF